jgi:predicted transcriptional regulator
MKNEILKLREEGKSYNEICKILGCSKANVSYHCGKGQKEKSLKRNQKSRKESVISRRVENFQTKRIKKKDENYEPKTKVTFNRISQTRVYDFQRGRGKNKRVRDITFTWNDVIEKFGWETICYLTGNKIDLREPKTYQFDHIVPLSKGGSMTIENLGICVRDANVAKHNMSVDELLELCKKLLSYNGYEVLKKN